MPSAREKIFSEFLIFCNLFHELLVEITAEYEKQKKYLPILHEVTWDNYFIVIPFSIGKIEKLNF